MDAFIDKLVSAAPNLVALIVVVGLFLRHLKMIHKDAKESTKTFLTHIEKKDNVLADLGNSVTSSQQESTRLVTEAVSKCENRMVDCAKEHSGVINKNTAVIGEIRGIMSNINIKINGHTKKEEDWDGKTERRTGLGRVTEPKAEGERRQA